jgi:hypothetical protein
MSVSLQAVLLVASAGLGFALGFLQVRLSNR